MNMLNDPKRTLTQCSVIRVISGDHHQSSQILMVNHIAILIYEKSLSHFNIAGKTKALGTLIAIQGNDLITSKLGLIGTIRGVDVCVCIRGWCVREMLPEKAHIRKIYRG